MFLILVELGKTLVDDNVNPPWTTTKKLAKVRLEIFYNYLLHNYCSYIYLVKFQFGEFFFFVTGDFFSYYNP
jgi:hypothetical protein